MPDSDDLLRNRRCLHGILLVGEGELAYVGAGGRQPGFLRRHLRLAWWTPGLHRRVRGGPGGGVPTKTTATATLAIVRPTG